ncbi:hypothetical protein CDAR_263011 [Caerostris darwini]|uniref:LAGLIDADG homing endonuclease n=1 Tax=Caerostris darwini TaxID=1538125 RepID=A0AAV4S0L3_9ARAC|nr:hypothetical protein CDAR_263011 [Caerostris darwini]
MFRPRLAALKLCGGFLQANGKNFESQFDQWLVILTEHTLGVTKAIVFVAFERKKKSKQTCSSEKAAFFASWSTFGDGGRIHGRRLIKYKTEGIDTCRVIDYFLTSDYGVKELSGKGTHYHTVGQG